MDALHTASLGSPWDRNRRSLVCASRTRRFCRADVPPDRCTLVGLLQQSRVQHRPASAAILPRSALVYILIYRMLVSKPSRRAQSVIVHFLVHAPALFCLFDLQFFYSPCPRPLLASVIYQIRILGLFVVLSPLSDCFGVRARHSSRVCIFKYLSRCDDRCLLCICVQI